MNVRQNRATKKAKTPTLPRLEDITPSGEAEAVVAALLHGMGGYFYHARVFQKRAEYTEEAEHALYDWVWNRKKPLARMVEAVYLSTQSSPVDLPNPDTALNRVKLIEAALAAEDAAYLADEKARAAEQRAGAKWHESAEANERWAKSIAKATRTGQQWEDTRKAVAGAIRLTRRLPAAMRNTEAFIDPRGIGVRKAADALESALRNVWEDAEAWAVGQNYDWRHPQHREHMRSRLRERVRSVLDDASLVAVLETTPSRGYEPPRDERATIAGIPVVVRDLHTFKGYGLDTRSNLQEIFKGIRLFRRQAERYFPEMLKPPYTAKPVILDMNVDRLTDYSGLNDGGTVIINGAYPVYPEGVAGTLAHELGHTAYMLLSPAAKEAWDDLVMEDGTFRASELFPLARELGLDPERNSLSDLASALHRSAVSGNVEHGWLYQQVVTAISEYVEGRHRTGPRYTTQFKYGGSEDSAFRTAPMAQVGEMSFPLNPTTAYGGNNPNEALAETFKHYVVDGPRAVNPRVRALFQQIFKGLRRNPDDDGDADDEG